MVPETEVAIIGAGPYGLSAAIHLRRAGVETHIFGDPMASWREMPKGMFLRSNSSATNMIELSGPYSLERFKQEHSIPEEEMPLGELLAACMRRAKSAALGRYVVTEGGTASLYQHPPTALSRFIDYGMWVQQNGVADLDPRMVTRLTRERDRFVLELEDGAALTARRVVIAAGITSFAHMPELSAGLFDSLVSHTGQHSDMSVFAGKRVAVLGSGQSAFESAVLMHEGGASQVEVLARGNVVWLRDVSWKDLMGPLGDIVYAPTDVGPIWFSRLVANPGLFQYVPRKRQDEISRRAIRPACAQFVSRRLGAIRVSTDVSIDEVSADDEGELTLLLSDGSSRHVDHLLCGTGYQVDITKYRFLDAALLPGIQRIEGFPVLKGGLESSIPGLHFAGAPAAWSFGPTMRFVSGSWYAGRAIATAVAKTRRQSSQFAAV